MSKWTLMLSIAIAGGIYLNLPSYQIIDNVPRERLGAIINSEYQEVRPFISPDGNTLYFSRRNHPKNTGGIKDYQDIWISTNINGNWSKPSPLGSPINNKKANTLCSITADGSYAILLDSYKKVKTPLVQVHDSPAGWGIPTELVIDQFANFSTYYDFFYHEQSKVLLMAIDDGSGHGDQDLHVSFKQEDGNYSRPINLGESINTKNSDFPPFLAADGRTLYFASYGHVGMGGSDFFVSHRMDDSWRNWTQPQNLGAGINSEDNENYLSLTGDYSIVYFESYPEGSEEKDIFRASLPKKFHPESMAITSKEDKLIVEQNMPTEPTATIDGTLSYKNKKEHTENKSPTSIGPGPKAPTAGKLQMERQDRAETFGNQSETRQPIEDLPNSQYFESGRLNSRVRKNNYFDYDSHQLSPDCINKLERISNVMLNNPSMEARLAGHTDSWGTYEANLRVSYLRAQSAAHFLVDQGIEANRLLVVGLGDQAPLASNDDEKEGRELNRRVEVTLSSPVGAHLEYTLR
jgi:outer membrane protein OmpA-like peptidoglycan-associated protein